MLNKHTLIIAMTISLLAVMVPLSAVFAYDWRSSSSSSQPSSLALQWDAQGNSTYSQNNFTDVVDDYESADTWVELKATLWLNENKTIAPFLAIVPTFSSNETFWWQNYVEYRVGFFSGAHFMSLLKTLI